MSITLQFDVSITLQFVVSITLQFVVYHLTICCVYQLTICCVYHLTICCMYHLTDCCVYHLITIFCVYHPISCPVLANFLNLRTIKGLLFIENIYAEPKTTNTQKTNKQNLSSRIVYNHCRQPVSCTKVWLHELYFPTWIRINNYHPESQVDFISIYNKSINLGMALSGEMNQVAIYATHLDMLETLRFI